MFDFLKKNKPDKELGSFIEILNDAFMNLYVADMYSNIPLIALNGHANSIQKVDWYLSSILGDVNLVKSISNKSVDERFVLHIFLEGFFVIEANYQERFFIILNRADKPIKTLDEMKLNSSTLYKTLNQNTILVLLNLLNELERSNTAYYEVLTKYIFDVVYKYFIEELSARRIDKRIDTDGFVYCIF
jgi:hypothetical protein